MWFQVCTLRRTLPNIGHISLNNVTGIPENTQLFGVPCGYPAETVGTVQRAR